MTSRFNPTAARANITSQPVATARASPRKTFSLDEEEKTVKPEYFRLISSKGKYFDIPYAEFVSRGNVNFIREVEEVVKGKENITSYAPPDLDDFTMTNIAYWFDIHPSYKPFKINENKNRETSPIAELTSVDDAEFIEFVLEKGIDCLRRLEQMAASLGFDDLRSLCQLRRERIAKTITKLEDSYKISKDFNKDYDTVDNIRKMMARVNEYKGGEKNFSTKNYDIYASVIAVRFPAYEDQIPPISDANARTKLTNLMRHFEGPNGKEFRAMEQQRAEFYELEQKNFAEFKKIADRGQKYSRRILEINRAIEKIIKEKKPVASALEMKARSSPSVKDKVDADEASKTLADGEKELRNIRNRFANTESVRDFISIYEQAWELLSQLNKYFPEKSVTEMLAKYKPLSETEREKLFAKGLEEIEDEDIQEEEKEEEDEEREELD